MERKIKCKLPVRDTASLKTRLKNYIDFMSALTGKFVFYVDVIGIKVALRFYLEDKEFVDLVHLLNSDNPTIVYPNKLKHPAIRKSLFQYCNKAIYAGSRHDDYYLSLSRTDNLFIQGEAGSGKTFYLNSLYRRLSLLDPFHQLSVYVWTKKTFEWKRYLDCSLYSDSQSFIDLVKESYQPNSHSVFIIDELCDLLLELNQEEQNELFSMIKNAQSHNQYFICSSQRMNTLINEISSTASVKVCFRCSIKDEYSQFLGRDVAELDQQGNMYVLRDNMLSFDCLKRRSVAMPIMIQFYGRYGEFFEFYKLDTGGVVISCEEIGMKNKHLSDVEFETLTTMYVTTGVIDFDRSNEKLLAQRIKNMETMYQREMRYFERTNNPSSKERAEQILSDLKFVKGEK